MTCTEEYNAIQDVVKLLADDGFNGLGEAIRRVINEAMRLELQYYLGVSPYERSEMRQGYANGFKPKTVKTRVGDLELDVPKVRDKARKILQAARHRTFVPKNWGQAFIDGIMPKFENLTPIII